MKIKKKIKKVLQFSFDPFARKLGYIRKKERNVNSLQSINKSTLLYTFFSNIQKQGFQPKAVYDIGANKGTWTKECLAFFPNASYFLFEPQEELKKDIDSNLSTNNNISVYSVGAGDSNETLKFTMHNRDDSRSFLYSEADAVSLGFEQKELPIVRLDTFIEQNNLPSPDLLKIDAEGYDLKVLKGAGKYLSDAEVVLVEVGIMNKMMPNNVKEVINFMDEKGFRLFEITDLNRPFKNNILWLCEFAFIRKNGKLDKDYAPQVI